MLSLDIPLTQIDRSNSSEGSSSDNHLFKLRPVAEFKSGNGVANAVSNHNLCPLLINIVQFRTITILSDIQSTFSLNVRRNGQFILSSTTIVENTFDKSRRIYQLLL